MRSLVLILVALILPFSGWSQVQPTSDEQKLVDELNQSRREAGLPDLKLNPYLVQSARQHAERMAQTGKLSHQLPGEPEVSKRISATGLRFDRAGENVGFSTFFEDLHPNFMKSPPHRENILEPRYSDVGVGIARGQDGTYWAAQNFAHVIEERTAAQAEELVAKAFTDLRRRYRSPRLERLNSATLKQLACRMGKAGKVNAQAVLGLPDVRYAVTYNNSNPEDLPESAQRLARNRDISKYSVATCFAQSPENPGGTYYVALAFY
ncbi:MAG TPA: CAP domain-containing protein [Terriglobales bacterium]|nr:CAP domain-containing protein [Terriglobales bacterium]